MRPSVFLRMVAGSSSSSSAASANYYWTYRLGSSVYVPLTSYCNSRTLPETRGPGFRLPDEVAACLSRVRAAEDRPPFPESLPKVESIPGIDDQDDEDRSPTPSELIDEIARRADETTDGVVQVVLAGEGEPTLRLDALLSVAKGVRRIGAASSVRVVTNGLAPVDVVARLRDAGVDSVSAALSAADPASYEILAEPLVTDAHDVVRAFVAEAARSGLDVEATAVDDGGGLATNNDKEATERLARELGVTTAVRWRPYFP